MLADLDALFKKRGVRLELAGRKRQLLSWFEQTGMKSGNEGIYIRSDLYLALKVNQSKQAADEALQEHGLDAGQDKSEHHKVVLTHSQI